MKKSKITPSRAPLIIAFALSVFYPMRASAQAPVISLSVEEGLARIDAFRVYDESGFSYDLTTTGDDGQRSKMRVSVRLGGEEAALVRYSEPVKQRGQTVLVRGNSFWLFQPGMRNALRIAPRQIIFGQASAGDISRISFGTMYAVESRKETDGAIEIGLKAKPGANATYDLVDLRVDLDYRPISARCRGKSGTLMKTIRYEKFETIAGKALLTEFVIVDEINKKSERLLLSGFDAKVPPLSEFSVQALRFSR